MSERRQTVVVYSGGLDSTTLLYHLLDLDYEVKAISFDYGQRHRRELDAATGIAARLPVEHRVVDVSGLSSIFGGNALTSHGLNVPAGKYSPETMRITTVPNRNMIMLSMAIGWAISSRFDSVAFGAHTGDYTPYPDCQPPFADAMNAVGQVCDRDPIDVLAPFIHWTKAQIVELGLKLGAPLEETWSCYEGGEVPCERCSTCVDRIQALKQFADAVNRSKQDVSKSPNWYDNSFKGTT